MIGRHKARGSIAGIGETVFIIIEPGSVWVRGFVDEARHLIPDFNGATFPSEWREALWARIHQLSHSDLQSLPWRFRAMQATLGKPAAMLTGWPRHRLNPDIPEDG